MSIMDNGTMKKLGTLVNENLPHILTGVASIGVVTTSVEAAKAVLAVKEIDSDNSDDRKPSEKSKTIVKRFIPTVISGVLTIGCIISSDIVHTKRYTSLLGAFLLTKSELPKYKQKIEETLGVEKAKEVDQSVKKELVREFDNPRVGASEASRHFRYRVVDLVTGASFASSYAALLRGEAEVAAEIARTSHCTLETFYSFVTDEVDYPEIATRIFWDQTSKYDMMNLRISAETTSDGEVYLTIDYEYNTR